MIRTDLTEYDIKPVEMINYLRYHGPHFSKELCKFAVSLMTKNDDTPIKAYTKEDVESILDRNGVKLKEKQGYDCVFVANMCKADYYGSSIEDEKHLAKFIKDYLEDPDGYDGIAFNRWLSDMARKGISINWEDML